MNFIRVFAVAVLPYLKPRGSIKVAALLLAAGGSVVAQAGELRTDGRFIRDPRGATVILRGINVAGDSKVPPFTGITDVKQLDPLPEWGFNVIRLVFTWEAYEPFRGYYNENYLNYITAVADAAWARGMYVIIDFHNDGYSRFVSGGCGQGFPLWSIASGSTPDAPDNGEDCLFWLDRLFSDPDTFNSFRQFFADTNGARTRYLIALQRVAQRFANRPGVIGYDVFTEPPADELLEIAPFLEDAAAAVRSRDPDAIILIEPKFAVAGGEVQTELPKPTFGNFLYAPHFYDGSVLWAKNWTGDSALTEQAFANMFEKSVEWNAPAFLGEFGGPAQAIGIAPYVDLLYQQLNLYQFSGAHWNYTPNWSPETFDGWNFENLSIVDDQGRFRDNFKIRPYPRRISGTPLEMNVSDNGQAVDVTWINAPATGLTEIFLPKDIIFGETPFLIETAGNGLICEFGPAGGVLFCGSAQPGGMNVRVRQCDPQTETCYVQP